MQQIGNGEDSGEADLHALLQGLSTGVDLGESKAEDLGEDVATWEMEGLGGLRRPSWLEGSSRGRTQLATRADAQSTWFCNWSRISIRPHKRK